jgi:hypothetical protein
MGQPHRPIRVLAVEGEAVAMEVLAQAVMVGPVVVVSSLLLGHWSKCGRYPLHPGRLTVER